MAIDTYLTRGDVHADIYSGGRAERAERENKCFSIGMHGRIPPTPYSVSQLLAMGLRPEQITVILRDNEFAEGNAEYMHKAKKFPEDPGLDDMVRTVATPIFQADTSKAQEIYDLAKRHPQRIRMGLHGDAFYPPKAYETAIDNVTEMFNAIPSLGAIMFELKGPTKHERVLYARQADLSFRNVEPTRWLTAVSNRKEFRSTYPAMWALRSAHVLDTMDKRLIPNKKTDLGLVYLCEELVKDGKGVLIARLKDTTGNTFEYEDLNIREPFVPRKVAGLLPA